ncbi:MAG: histidinol dehydrogenase [Chloroflexi bacterium]|nr:histidinol dehydrogenase [Chloroflexota bacterium]
MSRTILKEARPVDRSEQVALTEAVTRIISAVRQEGDEAVRRFSKEFDHVELLDFRVSAAAKEAALAQISPQDRADMEFAANNIRRFASAQLEALSEVEVETLPGVHLGHRKIPLDSAGVYVPGGRYPLPSAALMGILPARVAGVRRVAACAPPDRRSGTINTHTLAAMQVAGADEIYCVGGVQAIAALAYGTPSIAPVDIIVGPGNAYVTEAKRQVFGQVSIDFLAGPSEVLILADESAKPTLVAADLLAQAEHDLRARCVLVSTSPELIERVLEEMETQLAGLTTAEVARVSWENNGAIYLVSTLAEGVSLANELAPEHLQVHSVDWRSIWQDLTNYGSLFLGEDAPVVFGDYTSGTNHTLPTMGTARLHGGLWAGMFVKIATHQWMSPEGRRALTPATERLAALEGLAGHAAAARLRGEGR